MLIRALKILTPPESYEGTDEPLTMTVLVRDVSCFMIPAWQLAICGEQGPPCKILPGTTLMAKSNITATPAVEKPRPCGQNRTS